MADGVNGVLSHLNARDVAMLFAWQAPFERLQACRRRMSSPPATRAKPAPTSWNYLPASRPRAGYATLLIRQTRTEARTATAAVPANSSR